VQDDLRESRKLRQCIYAYHLPYEGVINILLAHSSEVRIIQT